MTVQNNHFTTQLQGVARPAATDKTSSRSTSTAAAASSTGDKAAATQTSASPVGLVGNHVNTTA
ncbi:hypothetical protein G3N95_19265 [Paraburkholderia sp. Tr-20389]|uniref:hypothetical protein n=1 Tax=Paraburkholderia sp. Tr-20389 TaxID=2703903 RepID=UPI00197F6BCC|nr:hypothetical protein [Paraburkholderia sp. Tr-20389]MBN3755093.1 hypothetical protein [Paraburkholderia sp. Tr-20389]